MKRKDLIVLASVIFSLLQVHGGTSKKLPKSAEVEQSAELEFWSFVESDVDTAQLFLLSYLYIPRSLFMFLMYTVPVKSDCPPSHRVPMQIFSRGNLTNSSRDSCKQFQQFQYEWMVPPVLQNLNMTYWERFTLLVAPRLYVVRFFDKLFPNNFAIVNFLWILTLYDTSWEIANTLLLRGMNLTSLVLEPLARMLLLLSLNVLQAVLHRYIKLAIIYCIMAMMALKAIWLYCFFCRSGYRPRKKKRSAAWPVELSIPEWIESLPESDLPSAFLCPISRGIMKQPAITPDGSTFDREFLARWISTKGTDPMTKKRLQLHEIAPNRALRSLIEEWIRQRCLPDALDSFQVGTRTSGEIETSFSAGPAFASVLLGSGKEPRLWSREQPHASISTHEPRRASAVTETLSRQRQLLASSSEPRPHPSASPNAIDQRKESLHQCSDLPQENREHQGGCVDSEEKALDIAMCGQEELASRRRKREEEGDGEEAVVKRAKP